MHARTRASAYNNNDNNNTMALIDGQNQTSHPLISIIIITITCDAYTLGMHASIKNKSNK